MTTPKRWINSPNDVDDFERAVLRSELDAQPPAGAESDVLARVMAAVAPFGPGVPDPSGSVGPATGGALGGAAIVKSTATLASLGKGFALGIGVSVAAATANHYVGGGSSRETATPAATIRAASGPASAVPSAAERSSRVEEPIENPPSPSTSPPPSLPHARRAAESRLAAGDAPGEKAPSAPSVASFPAPEAELRASRLEEEAALLRRARAELRSGALAAAFATLEASRQRFTAPELSQEREALAIELLHRSGERAAAAARARDFLARFPESPHAASVRAFANDAPR
jgi:hypothetical protein